MAKSYSDKLSDRRWQIRRNKILERDNYTCQHPCCKQSVNANLQVHHIFYFDDKSAWEYDDSLLVALCDVCHSSERTRPTIEFRLFNTLRMKGFLKADLLALSCKLETEPNFVRELKRLSKEFQKNG
jgi:5-methylcytosine-specific restriction endonuclease McrA